MANTQTLKLDQLFVREIFFRDFGNRPISSGQYLLTRGDGGIFFSNTSTGGVYSFQSLTADGVPKISASNNANNITFGAGPGISYSVSSNASSGQKLFINNLGIQQLGIYDTSTILSFSSFSVPTPAGRTLWFAGENGNYIRTSTDTVFFGSAYNSNLSTVVELASSVTELYEQTSTILNEVSTLLGEANIFFVSTSVSSFYSQLLSTQEQLDNFSTFLFTTVADDGNGNHNTLIVSSVKSASISTNTLSTTTVNTSTLTTKKLNIGYEFLYNSTAFTSTNACITFTSNGIVSTLTNSLHIGDSITNVDVAFRKSAFSSVSTGTGLTLYTVGQQALYGMSQKYSNAFNVYPIIQQVEAYSYTINLSSQSNVIGYTLRNTVIADEICSLSTLNILAARRILLSSPIVYTNQLLTSSISTQNLEWNKAKGNQLNISTLCVSTVIGVANPILTFDKTNYRVGVNLGQNMPLATVDVSGVIIANNFVTNSDRRLKSEIKELTNLPLISSYSYKMDGFDEIGVLADEIESIAPVCIYTRPDGLKAVSYPKLVPILISYIKDLYKRIELIETNKCKCV
jgi:hypothetical protein